MGILIALGCLVLGTGVAAISSIILSFNMNIIGYLRIILIFTSLFLLTAHSGAWLLVRHITLQPKYDIRVTSAAEEDGWDEEEKKAKD